jgi:hypothetical protein
MTHTPEELIAPLAVREFAAAGVIREATLLHTLEGWQMRIRMGAMERILRMREFPKPRVFSSVDAATRLAHKYGVPRLLVELASWEQKRAPRKRFAATAKATAKARGK